MTSAQRDAHDAACKAFEVQAEDGVMTEAEEATYRRLCAQQLEIDSLPEPCGRCGLSPTEFGVEGDPPRVTWRHCTACGWGWIT